MAKLEITGLKKSYGRTEVVHGVDLTVNDGEFVSLIGGSGCGKSTMLRMIAGLEEVTSGTIAIDGRVINDVEPKDRDIAMVFQNYALYPHLSVAENMGFSLSLRNVPKKEAAAAVAEAAALLGLSDYLDRRPKDLSGGQRQRVAMGRAIVRNPRIFLFDEPLSNLDAKLRVQMRLEIKALQRRLGTTAIYVTHDQVEALTMSDRLVLMNEGSVEQIGTPMEVYKRPANLFVATFIGSPSMNLIDAALTREGEAAFAEVEGLKIALPACPQAASGTPIKLGVRPEHLHIASDAAPGAGLKMEVAMVETTGAESHAYGRFGKNDITVTLSGEIGLAAGETIALTAETSLLHVFDAATGLRINQ